MEQKARDDFHAALAARQWREQGVVGALLLCGATGLGIYCLRIGWLERGTTGLETLLARQLTDRIDLNRADAAEIELLPGIGPVLAERIIQYRRQHGAFRTIESLDAVPGIGPLTIERIRSQIRVRSP